MIVLALALAEEPVVVTPTADAPPAPADETPPVQTDPDDPNDALLLDDYGVIVVVEDWQPFRDVERGAVEASEAPQTGVYELTRRDIESTPGSLEDVNRAIGALPGMVSDGDLLSAFHVRGAETSDTVFLLDRVPIDDPYHLAGFTSLFNPDTLRKVIVHTGAPPADTPAGTSAVVQIESWDGEPRPDGRDLDGAVELSMQSARAAAMGPIDRQGRWSFSVAGRRTYLEAYLQILKWAQLLDTAFAAPEFSELSARVAFRPDGRHRFLATAMFAGDSLAVRDSDDASSITINGTYELDDSLLLASLDHRYQSARLTWQTTAAFTSSRSYINRDLGGVQERTIQSRSIYVRSDGTWTDGTVELKAGADARVLDARFDGQQIDTRTQPTWTSAPLTDFGFGLVEPAGLAWRPRVAGWAQGTWKGPVHGRVGVRTTWDGRTGEVLPSPSVGLSVPLPTGTIPKVSAGLYWRTPRDVLALDPRLGNPELGSERALSIVAGVDQAFPLPLDQVGLLRVEGYVTRRDRLITTSNLPGLRPYEDVGTGLDAGLDVLASARFGPVDLSATWSFLNSQRYNPRIDGLDRLIPSPQDQRHTLALSAQAQVHDHWRVGGRWQYHSARPISQVEPAGPSTARLTCLNCDRIAPYHALDLRVEWRKAWDRVRVGVYLEVLNAYFNWTPYLPIATVRPDPDDPSAPGTVDSSFIPHLPTRPFLGVRLDY